MELLVNKHSINNNICKYWEGELWKKNWQNSLKWPGSKLNMRNKRIIITNSPTRSPPFELHQETAKGWTI